jgi:predicted HTH transcriptional regulator
MTKTDIEKMLPKNMNEVTTFIKRHKRTFAAVAIAVIIIIVLFFVLRPERSVACFCKVAEEEKQTIVGSENYEKRLETYKRLESVSPNEIRPDVTAIRKGQQAIVDNPANGIATEIGLSGSGSRLVDYITENCSENFWKR